MTLTPKNETKYLAIFLIVYFFLLVANINSVYLFIGDERTYSASILSLINGVIDNNNHPLLAKTIWAFFVYLTHGYLGIDRALFWRLGTIIFSLATTFVFYKISRLFFSKPISFTAITLLALDPMYFAFSRIMQLDVIALFFNLASLYFLLLYIKSQRDTLLKKAGLFLGLSLATKLSSIFIAAILPFLILYLSRGGKKLLGITKAFILYLVSLVVGFALGNFIFFFLKSGVNFFIYTLDLIYSQLTMPFLQEGFLSSPAWSWFTTPQILTLYRVDFIKTVTCVIAFQNPVLFASSLISVLLTIFLIIKNKIKNEAAFLVILIYFLAQYLPWFFSLHSTYYYYTIPLTPLIILMFVNLINLTKYSKKVLSVITIASVLIFLIYYPLLIGKMIPKSYEEALFSYSLYSYPAKDTVFCQGCSPRK